MCGKKTNKISKIRLRINSTNNYIIWKILELKSTWKIPYVEFFFIASILSEIVPTSIKYIHTFSIPCILSGVYPQLHSSNTVFLNLWVAMCLGDAKDYSERGGSCYRVFVPTFILYLSCMLWVHCFRETIQDTALNYINVILASRVHHPVWWRGISKSEKARSRGVHTHYRCVLCVGTSLAMTFLDCI